MCFTATPCHNFTTTKSYTHTHTHTHTHSLSLSLSLPGASLPDGIWTKQLGIPAFVVPYANHDEDNHAPNENMEVSAFVAGIRTSAALLSELGQMQRIDLASHHDDL